MIRDPVNLRKVDPLADLSEEEVLALTAEDDDGRISQLGASTFSYLAGAAGSGKTVLCRRWAEEIGGIELAATTGIAAINQGGTTINALLGYFDTKSLKDIWVDGRLAAKLGKLYKAGTRRIVLDEVSMLDGDQLTFLVEAIDQVNQYQYAQKTKKASRDEVDVDEGEGGSDITTAEADRAGSDKGGGLGLTLVGDFAQLSPVKAPFAFESPVWKRFAANTVTLSEIRRQADAAFISALRAARRGEVAETVEYFRSRLVEQTDDRYQGPTLFAKNDSVARYNWLRLEQLDTPEIVYSNRREGKSRSEWGSESKPTNQWGVPPILRIKEGALVMVLANKREMGFMGRPGAFRYVNGDLAEVIGKPSEVTCRARLLRTGGEVEIEYVRREVQQPVDAARRKELKFAGQLHKLTEDGKHEVLGWIEYMPLRLAYGSTVHKTQGLSLDAVQINLADHFFTAGGMLYVALSRARTVEGLRIVGTESLLATRCNADSRVKDWL